jgi:hypothetical protein
VTNEPDVPIIVLTLLGRSLWRDVVWNRGREGSGGQKCDDGEFGKHVEIGMLQLSWLEDWVVAEACRLDGDGIGEESGPTYTSLEQHAAFMTDKYKTSLAFDAERRVPSSIDITSLRRQHELL